MERRLIELRLEDGDRRRIGGRIPYNTPSVRLHNEFTEIILPGAFTRSIARNDVRALWNHDSAQVIGRTANQTLRFEDGPDALEVIIDLPDTQVGRDAYALVRDGYVSHMSFGFADVANGVKRQKDANGDRLRLVSDLELYEVSPVAFPAYPATQVDVRAWENEQIPGEGRQASPTPSVDSAVEAERALVQIRRRRLDLLNRLERER